MNTTVAPKLTEIFGEQTSDHAPVESMYGTCCRTCVAWQDDEGATEFGIAIPEQWPCPTARYLAAVNDAHARSPQPV